MTTFLFVNVLVSGIKILTMGRGLTRRTRFIAAMSLAVGLGVTIVPQFVNVTNDEDNFPRQGPLWPTRESWSPGFRGFRDAIIIVLSTGFSIGGFLCIVLNFVIPYGEEDLVEHSGYTEEEYNPGVTTKEFALENGKAPRAMEMHKHAV
jgi:xanthine/uracil permease